MTKDRLLLSFLRLVNMSYERQDIVGILTQEIVVILKTGSCSYIKD